MFYLIIINGLIDSFNPCAFGVIIFYLALLFSLHARRRLLLGFGIFYILSVFTAYLLIGLGLLKSFHLFGIHGFFGWLSAILVIALGFYHLKEYFLPRWQIPVVSPFLSRCKIPRPTGYKISIISGIILGFLVGICEFPCSGGIYLGTVALLSARQTFAQGIGLLLLYNLMFILPLIILLFLVSNQRIFEKFKTAQAKNTAKIKLMMGLSMLVTGLILLVWLII